MRISYWSSDVCASDLPAIATGPGAGECTVENAEYRPRVHKASYGRGHGLTAVRPSFPWTPEWQRPDCGTSLCRSEARRGGKECVRTCRSGGVRANEKKKRRQTEG